MKASEYISLEYAYRLYNVIIDAMPVPTMPAFAGAEGDSEIGVIPTTTYHRIWEEVAARTNDSEAGPTLYRALKSDAIECAILAFETCGSILECVHRLLGVGPHLGGNFFDVQERGASLIVEYGSPGVERPGRTMHLDSVVLGLGECLNAAAGEDASKAHFELTRQLPRDTSLYESLIGSNLEFGSRRNRIVIDKQLAQKQRPRMKGSVHEYFIKRLKLSDLATRRLRPVSGLEAQVESLISIRMGAADLSVAAVAPILGMSGRTLQRRLNMIGRSYLGVLNDVRQRTAKTLLAQDVPVSSISELLGFSEPSAFFRAFRRWTGSTPHAYQAAVQ